MSFEADIPTPTESILQGLEPWVMRIRELQRLVEQRTTELKEAQDDLNRLVLVQVPEAMEAAGLTSLKMRDGSTLSVKKDIKVNITQDNSVAAYAWLRALGHGMSIKQVLEVDLRTIPEDARGRMSEVLHESFDAEPVVTETIHNATLRSIVSAMLEAGKTVPPCVGVFEFKKASVKEKRG
jgi:hypothetical protein